MQNYNLLIIGEGEDREKLEKYINVNKLNENIYLKGFCLNHLNLYQNRFCIYHLQNKRAKSHSILKQDI